MVPPTGFNLHHKHWRGEVYAEDRWNCFHNKSALVSSSVPVYIRKGQFNISERARNNNRVRDGARWTSLLPRTWQLLHLGCQRRVRSAWVCCLPPGVNLPHGGADADEPILLHFIRLIPINARSLNWIVEGSGRWGDSPWGFVPLRCDCELFLFLPLQKVSGLSS